MPGQDLGLRVDEKLVLEKYDGEPVPENLIERLTVLNGKIIEREIFDKEVT